MTQPKYDWLKAVKERPEDAAAYIEWASKYVGANPEWSHPYCAKQPLKRLREAARVPSVEEAAIAFAEAGEACFQYWCKGLRHELPQPDADTLRTLAQAYREARAREAAESGGE